MEILRIEPAWSFEEIRNGVRAIVDANHVDEALIRVTITAGERPTTRGAATITSRSLPEIPAAPSLHIASSARRISGPLSQCKAIGRVLEAVAYREAESEGAFDAILLNEKGRVVETTARNLFVVSKGGLHTPPTYDGALAGVTRAAVLMIAAEQKMKAREASLTIDQLRAAEEVFLTGSGVGILGIASVDGHRYPMLGPITQKMRESFERLLDSDAKW